MNNHPLSVILHNIRSTHNVGAMLRTADGAGAHKVYLCGCTPTPVDRFGRKRKDITKTSLGAEDMVSWEHVEEVLPLIAKLKTEGVRVVAVEQCAWSVRYTTLTLDQPTALVFGEEVYGIPDEVLRACDLVAEIPMHGKKESLNVSVAAGIALYHVVGGRF
ncbi:MAG: TrmH family RNA methyltransferase [Candidatus Pacebacteria bacterium]|nr:TrmH family RNA methyltransferase [Candidatus Paceibacterota bacterium]